MMIELKSGLRSVTDKEQWAERGASFVAKVKGTKAVWFPPEPAKTGKQVASTTKKATKKPTRKTTAAARKSAAGAKRVTKQAPRKRA